MDGVTSSIQTQLNAKQDDLFDFYTKKGIILFDDFWYSQVNTASLVTSQFSFSLNNSAQIQQSNSVFGIVPFTNQRGIGLLNTGTNVAGSIIAYIGNISSVTNNTIYLIGNGEITYETYILFPLLSDLTNRFTFHYGICTGIGSSSPATDYIGIVYNEGIAGYTFDNSLGGSPYFTFMTSGNSTRTQTIGSSLIAINTWYKLKIVINATATSVGFYVNDVLVATHTTNIPLTTTKMQPYMLMGKNTGILSRQTAVDYIAYKQVFTNPRT